MRLPRPLPSEEGTLSTATFASGGSAPSEYGTFKKLMNRGWGRNRGEGTRRWSNGDFERKVGLAMQHILTENLRNRASTHRLSIFMKVSGGQTTASRPKENTVRWC